MQNFLVLSAPNNNNGFGQFCSQNHAPVVSVWILLIYRLLVVLQMRTFPIPNSYIHNEINEGLYFWAVHQFRIDDWRVGRVCIMVLTIMSNVEWRLTVRVTRAFVSMSNIIKIISHHHTRGLVCEIRYYPFQSRRIVPKPAKWEERKKKSRMRRKNKSLELNVCADVSVLVFFFSC